jgi:hypothetical protein
MNTTSTIDPNVNTETLYAEPYNKVLPEILAVQEQEVMQITVDIASVVAAVLGCFPEIFAMRDEIARELPGLDLSIIDKLDTYATALAYANACYLTSCESPDALRELTDEGVNLRQNLFADLSTLCTRGLINADALKDYSGQMGFKTVATDLQIVTMPLRQNWAAIAGKCATQLDELDRGEKLAMRILRLVGMRAQAPVTAASAATNRGRAFTLLVNKYDQVRRAISYLRWDHDDADSIAPSLFAGRVRKPAPAVPATTPAVPPTTPAQAGQAAPATPFPATVNTAPSGTKPLNVPVPGSNPFMS